MLPMTKSVENQQQLGTILHGTCCAQTSTACILCCHLIEINSPHREQDKSYLFGSGPSIL